MGRLSRILVLISMLVALGIEVHLGARELGQLLLWCEIAFVVACVAAPLYPRAVVSVALTFTYVSPALLAFAFGRFRMTYSLIWVAAMLGGIIGSRPFGGWTLPPRWRWPLVTWALVVSVAWPLLVWREVDFHWSLLNAYRMSNTSFGVAPPVVAVGILDAALTHGLGILWFDWLYARFRETPRQEFYRFVLLPLAVSALLACALGTYQGFVDISFWSGGQWPLLQRAAGSMVDANAFGTVAALWGPAFVAMAVLSRRRGRYVTAAAALVLSWTGLWASGSRTALLAGVIGLVAVASAAFSAAAPRASRLRILAVLFGATAAAIAASFFLPALTIGPLRRFPALSNPGQFWAFFRELSERNGFGTNSVIMFREFPLVGVGIGAFALLVVDYSYSLLGTRTSFDNAQNWFRHQLAELGILGSVGWILWVILFTIALLRTRGEDDQRLPARAIKGALVGFGAASMLGVPGQNSAVTLTFWTFAFWYLTLAVPREYQDRPALSFLSRPIVAWGLTLALVFAHAGGTYYVAHHQLSVPQRAVRFGWNYNYGFYDLERGSNGQAYRWTARHAVAVVPVTGRALRFEGWINHPDAQREPVDVRVWLDSTLVIDTRLRDTTHLARELPMPPGAERVVVRVWVSRTWRPGDHGLADKRELGVAVADWTFVSRPPEAGTAPESSP